VAGASITRRRQVDAVLGRLVAALGPFSGCRAAGRALEAALDLYRAAGYRQDRATGRRPPGVNGLAFDVLATGCPTGFEWLRKNIPPTEWANGAVEIAHAAQ
jgi:hypothetical protein